MEMEVKAKLKNVYQNRADDCIEAVFEIPNEDMLNLRGQDLRMKLTKWSEHRSLDANKYCWKLCTLLAEKLKSSKDEIYEEELFKYGYLDDPVITITVLSKVDMRLIDGHWKYYSTSSDGKFKSYMRVRGSSEYDRREMAHFLDMIIQDCKEQDIETLPPAELERLKQAWEK